MRRVCFLILLGVLSSAVACGSVSKVYVWTQKENGVGMTAPIAHIVRVHVDPARHAVDWMEDVIDKNGKSDRQIYNFRPADCTAFFGEDDWTCVVPGLRGEAVITAEMKAGNLSRKYWGEDQAFHEHYLLFGHPM